MSFAARRLGAVDAALYREIRLEALRGEPTAFASDFGREADKSLDDWAVRLSQNYTFGVFDGDDLKGVATYIPEGMEKTAHRAHLVAVYVRPEARGKGAGRVLFEALIEDARRHVLQLHLAVVTGNEPARRLYERFGFRVYGTDPRGLYVEGRYHDDYLMVLRLDEGGRKVTDNE